MGFGSIGHWLIVLLVVLLVFGAGRLPKVMSDIGKGVRALRDGLKEDDNPTQTANKEVADDRTKPTM